MGRIQLNDVISIDDLTSGYAQHSVERFDFWLCFVPYITPDVGGNVNDGHTFIIAERLATPDTARVVHILADVWPDGEGSALSPTLYAQTYNDNINEYFALRFGGIENDPLVLWTAEVVAELRTWRVDGIRLVAP